MRPHCVRTGFHRDGKPSPMSWCCRDTRGEFVFTDATHAILHAEQEGRMLVCPDCAKVMLGLLERQTYKADPYARCEKLSPNGYRCMNNPGHSGRHVFPGGDLDVEPVVSEHRGEPITVPPGVTLSGGTLGGHVTIVARKLTGSGVIRGETVDVYLPPDRSGGGR